MIYDVCIIIINIIIIYIIIMHMILFSYIIDDGESSLLIEHSTRKSQLLRFRKVSAVSARESVETAPLEDFPSLTGMKASELMAVSLQRVMTVSLQSSY